MRDPLEEFELFPPHCFRHTFATRCFEAGIAPKTVQAYLGHASLKMTMDLYTHVLKDHKYDEINKLEELMKELSEIPEEELEKILNEKLKNTHQRSNLAYLADYAIS